jgi:hypothetical protein
LLLSGFGKGEVLWLNNSTLECLKTPFLSWWSEVASPSWVQPTVPSKVFHSCACLAPPATRPPLWPATSSCTSPLHCNSSDLHCQQHWTKLPAMFRIQPHDVYSPASHKQPLPALRSWPS